MKTVLLRHLGNQGFSLEESFVFRGPSGSWRVNPEDLTCTDLTSVPWFFRWYVPNYGPHLLPALLHDKLIEQDGFDRFQADEIFNEALKHMEVAPLRRWLMLAAVTLATRWQSWTSRIALIVWFALAAIGILTVVNGISGWWQPDWWGGWLVWLSIIGPIPGSVLWGKHWVSGILGGYSLIVMAPVTLLVWITRAVTGIAEVAVEPETLKG